MKKNKEKQQYLPEDQDLLTELESIGPLSTGQALEEQKKRVQVVQIKALLKSHKSMNELNKSTTRYSIILGAFALIQIMIILMQFILEASTSSNIWLSFTLVVTCAIFIIWMLLDLNKILKDK
jgi:archaellum biogenesis protein FlaJ (TadC family)